MDSEQTSRKNFSDDRTGDALSRTIVNVQARLFRGRFAGDARILRAHQGTGGGTTQCTGNGTHCASHHRTHWASHHNADGGTRGRTDHHTTSRKHRVGFALGFPGLQRQLCRGVRVLRWNAVAGTGLFGEVFVSRCCLRRRVGGWVHVLSFGVDDDTSTTLG
jgi:hypothetical protein